MSDMREALNAAMDATAAADEEQNFDETPQEVVTDEITAESDDDSGAVTDGVQASASPEVDPDGDRPPEEETAGTAPAQASAEAEAEKPANNDSIKAPIDWGPQERESWSKIPRNLQEKVMAREKQIGELMQNTSEARKTHEAFDKLSQQYGAVLSGIAGNNTVEQAGALFDTVAGLRMGSPIQKAQIIADMISNFGVDINTLDSALVGEPAPQATQESARIDQLVAERLAPFEQMMGQQNAYKDQQAKQAQDSANTEVQKFAESAEFIQDVRMDMADLLDLADKRGQQMTMQEAYDKACILNPQIQSVLAERKQRADLLESNNSLEAKKNAASSVNGRQVGGGGGSSAMSMRDTIANAWDSQGKV